MESPQKSQSYENFGGINTKVSYYLTPKTEFLNLQNVDFRVTGALHTFAGTGNYNYSALNDIVTGIASFYAIGATYQFGAATYLIIATGASRCFNVTGLTSLIPGTATPIYSNIFPNNPTQYDFVAAQQLFSCNQYDFFKYPAMGVTITAVDVSGVIVNFTSSIVDFSRSVQYSLPKPLWSNFSVTGVSAAGGMTGPLDIYSALQRVDGFIGPVSHVTAMMDYYLTAIITMPQLNVFVGASVRNVNYADFDIQGTYLWVSRPQDGGNIYSVVNQYASVGGTYLFGSSHTTFVIGATMTLALLNQGFTTPNTDYLGTFIYGLGPENGSSLNLNSIPVNPSTIELYNNQMFFSGFFADPDIVWYSNIGDYEKRDLENFFYVRYKDGDIVTNVKSYFTQLVCFKQSSISTLTGDNPDNFALSEVTDQYGTFNSKTAATWFQKLWFLDSKGICEYNGADTRVVSDKVEPIFQRMNVEAAKKNACMIFAKERNEIWCSIPVDGSTYCNMIVVYDYIADAWTTRTTSSCSTLAGTKDNSRKQIPFEGNFLGGVRYYDSDLSADTNLNLPAQPFTQIIKARFLADMGHTVEKQFRRLYTDITVPPGLTFPMLVNFYADQGVTPYMTMTFAISEFQRRLDFGIPASDLSVEYIYSGTTALQFNGFTIEYRFQRSVTNNG